MPTYTVYLTNWVDGGGAFGNAWVNPGNAEYTDGVYATQTQGASLMGSVAHSLNGTIPTAISPAPNEQIASLVLTVERYANQSGAQFYQDHFVGIANYTAINKASGGQWPTSLTAITYTWSTADLFALGVSLDTVQRASFGINFQPSWVSSGSIEGFVDSCILTVNTVVIPASESNLSSVVIPPYALRSL